MAVPRAQYVILVAEDEPSIRQLITRSLRDAGYQVYEARNAGEALALFGQHGAQIDLALVDLRMPYMGGHELVATLRARRGTLKVLLISGQPVDPNEVTEAFLQKPFTRDQLLTTVRRVLETA